MNQDRLKEFMAEQQKKRIMFVQNLAFNRLKTKMLKEDSMFDKNENVMELIRTMQ